MRTTLLLAAAALALVGVATAADPTPPIQFKDGRLEYLASDLGDRPPDFSACGYSGGERPIPSAGVSVVVQAGPGDATARIQRALDYVSSLPADELGVRGAVLLGPGEHRVAGQLRIAASGVVLRGAGAQPGGTVLIAAGLGRRPLIRIEPTDRGSVVLDKAVDVVQPYVPVGASELQLAEGHALQPGDRVRVTRNCTDEWIELLGTRAPGVGWRAGRCDIRWRRTVLRVDGPTITLDAPLTTALEQGIAPGEVAKIAGGGRLAHAGVEDMTLRSEHNPQNPRDEEHSWHGVVANNAEDCWVRRVRFQHFAGGAVLLRERTQRVSVVDCLSLAPVGEVGGYRRHSFFTQGQQTLFLRCWAEEGLHDFAAGHCAAGPNAFVHCYAHNTHGASGPLESWASGVLYDNVRIDGGDLFFGNRWLDPPGAGWAAANCVAWQCQAAQIHCFQPPGAQNWTIGYWAQPVGDGLITGQSDFVRPVSLYQQQTRERLGDAAAERVGPLLLTREESTSPSRAQAQAFVERSNHPPKRLVDVIERRMQEAALAETPSGVRSVDQLPDGSDESDQPPQQQLKLVNGWLTIDGRVVTGKLLSPTWWRGVIRPDDAPAFGPSITRFAPGRYGIGLTDELAPTMDWMKARGVIAYEHHYGLWYDRRRDDHLMVRRGTPEVAPPFYEQPFARSGKAAAWDGLSRYDLTRFNAWYWRRLADFAGLCDANGAVLLHLCYFQHNILEAGAHWADCPWRPANNVNQTGITEPPPYIGDKRIFIAHQFYDPANEPLRRLHRGYLAQCAKAFEQNANVVHLTSAEYTGPQEFTEFWLRTMHNQQRSHQTPALLGLSAAKDVQDALLAQDEYNALCDLIDIRYWCYDKQGGLYAPPGGANMAPRQHLRQVRAPAGDFHSVARAVREYRTGHPGKAITFSAHRVCRTTADGWAVLMGGGSLAELPGLPDQLRRDLVGMLPRWSPGDAVLRLADDSGKQLCYLPQDDAGDLLGDRAPGKPVRVRWIDPATGAVTADEVIPANARVVRRQALAWVTPAE